MRSRRTSVNRSEPKVCVRSSNGKLDLTITEPRSQRSERPSNCLLAEPFRTILARRALLPGYSRPLIFGYHASLYNPGKENHVQTHTIAGGRQLKLHVREWGQPDARAILFIHGWSQNHLCWSKQIESPLAEEFRLVAIDIRGHGQSEAPLDAESYTTGALWADDVKRRRRHGRFAVDGANDPRTCAELPNVGIFGRRARAVH